MYSVPAARRGVLVDSYSLYFLCWCCSTALACCCFAALPSRDKAFYKSDDLVGVLLSYAERRQGWECLTQPDLYLEKFLI